MYFALVIVVTKFAETGELKEITLGAKKITTFRALFRKLGFLEENILVVSDVEGENGSECISTPEKLISHLTTQVKSKVSGGVLMTFVITHGVRLLTDEGSEPGLCMKQSGYSQMTNAWTNVLPVSTLGETLRGIGAESVLLVLEACQGAFGNEQEWRTEVEGFTQILKMPHFLREPVPEELIKGMYLLFSTSSEEKGHEGSHLTKFIDECLSGRGRVDEQGNVRASHFVLQLCRDMPHPPHLSAWRMRKSQDFVLSPRPVVVEIPILASKSESILVNDWKQDIDGLLNMVKSKVQVYDPVSIHESEQLTGVLSSMRKLLELIKEEREGMDEGCVDYGTPSRISSYRHSWETLLIELHNALFSALLGANSHLASSIQQSNASVVDKIEKLLELVQKNQEHNEDVLHPPFLHPEQICLDRQTEVDSLWKKVCGSKSVVGIVGVHGQGGIGKTILAQLLFRHPELSSTFPDGQYWITVGESEVSARLLKSQTHLYRALSKEWWDASFADSLEARIALERIIGKKRCLVVLDDVWKSRNVIESFGSNALPKENSPCRFVVTTRDSTVVGKGILHELKYLTDEETVRLLKKESGLGEEEFNENQLKDLASRCGKSPIPLVVSIVGGLLQEYLESTPDFEEAVNQVCELIDETGIIYKTVPHALKGHEESLETTLMSSVEAACRDKDLARYGVKNLIYDLSVFPDDTKIPKKLLESVWIRRQVPKSVCTRLLAKLARMSIIQRFENDDNHFGIHDSIRSYMLAKSQDAENRHGLVVNAYRDLCEDADPWWKGEESESLTREILEYMRVHLTYHLNSMQDHDSIFELVSNLDWIIYRGPLEVLLKDCSYFPHDPTWQHFKEVKMLCSALRLSIPGWNRCFSKEDLLFELSGRLPKTKSGGKMKYLGPLLDEVNKRLGAEVEFGCLDAAGEALYESIKIGSHVAAVTEDGEMAATVSSTGDQNCVKLWDLHRQRELGWISSSMTEEVTSLVISGDKNHIISISKFGKKVKRWKRDQKTGDFSLWEEEQELEAAEVITAIACDYKCENVVCGSRSGLVRVWNILEYHKDERYKPEDCEKHKLYVTSCAMVENAAFFISGSRDNSAWIWQRKDNHYEALYIQKSTQNVNSVAIAYKRERKVVIAVSGCNDGSLIISLYDIARNEAPDILCPEQNQESGIVCLDIIVENSECYIVSGSRDRTLRIWSVTNDNKVQCIKGFRVYGERISCAGFTKDMDVIHAVSLSLDEILRFWNIGKNEGERSELKGHWDYIRSVATDGTLALSGSDDNTVCLWNLKSESKNFGDVCDGIVTSFKGDVTSVALSPNSETALFAWRSKAFSLWNVTSKKCVATLEGHSSDVLCAAFNSKGTQAVSGSADKTVRLWDLDKGKCLHEFKGHTDCVSCVAGFSHNLDEFAISGSYDKTLHVLNLNENERGVAFILKGHTDGISCVASTTINGTSYAISGSHDNTIKIWNLQTRECESTIDCYNDAISSIAVVNNSYFLAGSHDCSLRLWDIMSRECRWRAFFDNDVTCVACSFLNSDTIRVVTGTKNGRMGALKLTVPGDCVTSTTKQEAEGEKKNKEYEMLKKEKKSETGTSFDTKTSRGVEPDWQADCVNSESVVKLKIEVITGDLTRIKTDGILKPASEHLSHEGAISASLRKAGGMEFEREMQVHVRKYGTLALGHCVMTGGGLLNLKIIHSNVPEFSSIRNDNTETLRDSVRNAIQLADECDIKTFTVPAVGSGVLGYSDEASAKACCGAIDDLIESKKGFSKLKCVKFVNSSTSKTSVFTKEVKYWFQTLFLVRHGRVQKDGRFPLNKEGKKFASSLEKILQIKPSFTCAEKCSSLDSNSEDFNRIEVCAETIASMSSAIEKYGSEELKSCLEKCRNHDVSLICFRVKSWQDICKFLSWTPPKFEDKKEQSEYLYSNIFKVKFRGPKLSVEPFVINI